MFQTRKTKVFLSAVISLLIGAVILKVLGNNPPLVSAFSLSGYYSLEPVEELISSYAVQSERPWNRIEIYYNTPKNNDIYQLPSTDNKDNYKDFSCHFIVLNGVIGRNGQIQPTQTWQKQLSIAPGQTNSKNEHTIGICIITDGKTRHPTDFQAKRTEALAESLSRKFDIQPAFIYYPFNWLK